MSNLKNISEIDFKEEILESKVPVLVDFWASWCSPCKVIGPILEDFQKEYEDKLKIVKINIDDSPKLIAKYEIQSIPNMILFKDGIEVDRIIGVAGLERFREMFNKLN